jgi:hypothetical protein
MRRIDETENEKRARAKEYHRQYYAANREKWHQYNAACYEKNKETQRQYYAANRETFREKNRQYYAANSEKSKEYGRRYFAVNREKIREYNRQYQVVNREEINNKRRLDYAANREAIREIDRKWRSANREKLIKRERQRTLKRYYGLTVDQWDTLFESQGRRCAICRSSEPKDRNWHTDHDHSTGKVRGILCRNCNHILGLCCDNPKTLSKAAKYLIRNQIEPVNQMGDTLGLFGATPPAHLDG